MYLLITVTFSHKEEGIFMVKVIGILGPMGSGKTTAAKFIQDKFGYTLITMGDLVRKLAAEKGLPPTRENLQKIQKIYTSRYGDTYFINEVIREMRNKKLEKVIIDGMRRVCDVTVPLEEFKDNILLILIDANPKIRFERIQKRGRPGAPKTFEEFQRQEKREFELFNFTKSFSFAHVTIENNNGLDEFYRQIEEVAKKYNFV